MSVSISAVSRLVGQITQQRISLTPVVGGYELGFTIEGDSVSKVGNQPTIWLAPLQMRISIGADLQALGTALPDHALRVRTLQSPAHFAYVFKLSLSTWQMAAIEEIRDGRDLPFQVVLSGSAGSEVDLGQQENFQVTLTHRVPQSEWVHHLQSARAADILLLEVPMPFVDPPQKMASIAEKLRRAQRQYVAANYTECIVNCRKAIEALEDLVSRDRDSLLKLLATDRNRLDKDQRRTVIEAALYHFGGLAAHDGVAVFDRKDARLALVLTSALIAYEFAGGAIDPVPSATPPSASATEHRPQT